MALALLRRRLPTSLPASDRVAVRMGVACRRPHESQYFMMIVGVYLTLGVFLLNAARKPQANLSLIWFTVWSSVVHAAIMAVQSFGGGQRITWVICGGRACAALVAIVLGGARPAAASAAPCRR